MSTQKSLLQELWERLASFFSPVGVEEQATATYTQQRQGEYETQQAVASPSHRYQTGSHEGDEYTPSTGEVGVKPGPLAAPDVEHADTPAKDVPRFRGGDPSGSKLLRSTA